MSRRRFSFALGDAPLGPDALALAANAELAKLGVNTSHPAGPFIIPAGLLANPIPSAANPYPHDPSIDVVRDRDDAGDIIQRAVPWYYAHPVLDASGWFAWTGPDSGQNVDGLTAAQLLALQILLARGDTSFSANYYPKNVNQYTAANTANPQAIVTGAAPAPLVVDRTPAPGFHFDTPVPPMLPDAVLTPVDAPDVAATVKQILDSVGKNGGDVTAPTAVVSGDTGNTLAVVRQLSPEDLAIDVPASHRDSSLISSIFGKVTGVIDDVASGAQAVSNEAQRIANAARGAATGAETGYNLPLSIKPLLIGAAVIGAVVYLSKPRR